jgi:hypothetical protein
MLASPSIPVAAELWRSAVRYTVHACANPVFGAPDRRADRRSRRILLRCAAGCDSRKLEHDWTAGSDILDDLHIDDPNDRSRDDHDRRATTTAAALPTSTGTAVPPPVEDPLYAPPSAGLSGDPSAAMPSGAEVTTVGFDNGRRHPRRSGR